MSPYEGDGVRLVADAMLGSLARKLRALGFDTAYYKTGDDAGIIELAGREERIILTADRSLASLAGRRGVKAILLSGSSDSARVKALVESARLSRLELRRGDSRCSVCGGELSRLGREEAAGRVPRAVLLRHRQFYACTACGKAYWKGGHWKKLRSFERLLGE